MKKLVIFDFDGTIADTAPDCVDCFNEAFRLSGVPAQSAKRILRAFGKTLPEIVSDSIPKKYRTRETVAKIVKAYPEIYGASEKPKTKPFPGIPELLESLRERGIALAVHSNKLEAILKDMAVRYFPGIPFDFVRGYRPGQVSKPAPQGVFEMMKEAGVIAKETLYVGDSASDTATAKAAGIEVVLVTWGTGQPEDREDPYVSVVAGTVQELKETILRQ